MRAVRRGTTVLQWPLLVRHVLGAPMRAPVGVTAVLRYLQETMLLEAMALPRILLQSVLRAVHQVPIHIQALLRVRIVPQATIRSIPVRQPVARYLKGLMLWMGLESLRTVPQPLMQTVQLALIHLGPR